MAINPLTAFPTKIDSGDPSGYPFGKAQDVTTPGDGTGTPWVAQLLNDVLGFQQALLKEPSTPLVPSGTPDKVGASQYLDALKTIITETAGGGGFGANDNLQPGDYNLLVGDYGGSNDVTVVYTGSGGETFTNLTSASLSAGDYVFIEHRGAGILTVALANASDRFGPIALGVTTINLNPGEVLRLQLTGTTNVWRVG